MHSPVAGANNAHIYFFRHSVRFDVVSVDIVVGVVVIAAVAASSWALEVLLRDRTIKM